MQDMREDVEEQCSQYGRITGLAINEQNFTVLIRYSSEAEAVKCKNVLDGKLFDGRRISVQLSKDEYVYLVISINGRRNRRHNRVKMMNYSAGFWHQLRRKKQNSKQIQYSLDSCLLTLC